MHVEEQTYFCGLSYSQTRHVIRIFLFMQTVQFVLPPV